jgi:phenylacetate-coenzyme A ligase PaaK-like adenylate-forming protein
MRDFHLVFGHSLVLLKSLEGKESVNPDELGYMLVSKIGATNSRGQNILPTGMIFLNYMTGDAARLTRATRCQCGRNTPVLYDIQRIEFSSGKSRHGCQVA